MLVEACELLEGWGGCEREGKGAYCLFVLLVVRDDSPFFPALLVRALLNIPSGTTRLRSSSISSIVLSCPSVNFVKYASGKMSVRWRRGAPGAEDALRCHFFGSLGFPSGDGCASAGSLQ